MLVCRTQTAHKAIRKAIRRTLSNKVNKRKKYRLQELKGSKVSLTTKEYFFRQIKNDDWELYSLALNKDKVNQKFREKEGKAKLYNFLSRYLLDKLPLKSALANVRLIVDRSKNREEIREFNRYVQNHIQGLLPLNTGFGVEHLDSQEDRGLQVVDLFCWGIFRKYEFGDSAWLGFFNHKIKYFSEYPKEGET